MEVEFTEDQTMLRSMARDFLAAECPKTKVRELEDDEETGYSQEIWGKMADLGWQGLIIPEEYGGQGMTFQHLAIIIQEMGRNVLPGPFLCSTIGGTTTILEAGTEEQKKEYLPKIASGELVFTLAIIEGRNAYAASDINLKAAPEGDNFVLNGTKLFVEMAQVADYMVCVARTGEGSSLEDGITLFIVDTKIPGISCEIIPTMGLDKQCEVRFENVVVSKENILGELDKGWPIAENILRKGAIAKSAESVGGMEASLEMTVAYSKERVQYDRPIGVFQALQHWMSDMYIFTEVGKYLLYKAAWMEAEGMPCDKETCAVKEFTNEAYKALTEKAVRLHGGIGTTRDHDIGLYYRRAKTASIAFGDTRYQRKKMADYIGLIK